MRDVEGKVFGQLVVLEGPESGRACEVGARDVVIGSHIDCDLVLHDDRVSGRHAAIWAHEGGFELRDLGSRNGTWFEGTRVTQVRLQVGATLFIARTPLRIEPEVQPVDIAATAGLIVRSDLPYADARAALLQEFERRYFAEVLARWRGNIAAAARAAGIEEKHLRALARTHGVAFRSHDDD